MPALGGGAGVEHGNNLIDITLEPEYSAICGYTEADLDAVFAPEFPGLDRDEIRRWYNGYSWLGKEKVYNPFDVLLLFRRRRFGARLYRVLRANDFDGLEAMLEAFFAGIPYQWHTRNDIADYEGCYASVFYACFAAAGLDVTVEDSTSRGRVDMTVVFDDHVYLFEFKVVESAPEGAAMAQLRERRYAEKYRGTGRSIHLIAVELSKETRNLAAFEVARAGCW